MIKLRFAFFILLLVSAGVVFAQENQNQDEVAKVYEVTLITLESFPPQYQVLVSGEFVNGCYSVGKSEQAVEDDKILITLYAETIEETEGVMCIQALIPYELNIDIDISGLSIGEYSVSVNGIDADAPVIITEVFDAQNAPSDQNMETSLAVRVLQVFLGIARFISNQ